MPKTPTPEPNRLHESSITVLSKSPRIGILDLHTDKGLIDLAINVTVAEMLYEELRQFLGK